MVLACALRIMMEQYYIFFYIRTIFVIVLPRVLVFFLNRLAHYCYDLFLIWLLYSTYWGS